MRPYKIFKNVAPLAKKITVITELSPPNVPLKFFKMTVPPFKQKYVLDDGLPEFIRVENIPSVIY